MNKQVKDSMQEVMGLGCKISQPGASGAGRGWGSGMHACACECVELLLGDRGVWGGQVAQLGLFFKEIVSWAA